MTGIGGVFFAALPSFAGATTRIGARRVATIWSLFPEQTELDAVLGALRREGATVDERVEETPDGQLRLDHRPGRQPH